MPSKPFFADEKKVERVGEAYRAQDDALAAYDPTNPTLSTPPAADAEPGTDPTPKQIDTSFARPFGGKAQEPGGPPRPSAPSREVF